MARLALGPAGAACLGLYAGLMALGACADDTDRVADAQCQMVGVTGTSTDHPACVQSYTLQREQKAISDNYDNLAHPTPIAPRRNGQHPLPGY